MKLGYKWDIIIKKNNGESYKNLTFNNFIMTDVTEGTFIADPFLIKRGDVNYMFYEICDYKKGRIACSIINDDLSITDSKIILDFENHLSYPFLMEDNGKLYMVPESSKEGKIFILENKDFPTKWDIVKEINIAGKDSNIIKKDGVYYLITTIGDNNNLSVFYSDSLLGEWTLVHRKNYNLKSKRNGGKIFKDENGDLIRPTQYDIRDYGESLSFNKIIISKEHFSEEEIINYRSPIKDTVGLHHYNFNEDYIIMDINKKINYNQKKYV